MADDKSSTRTGLTAVRASSATEAVSAFSLFNAGINPATLAMLGKLGGGSATSAAAATPPVDRLYDTPVATKSATLEQVDKVNDHYLLASQGLEALRKETGEKTAGNLREQVDAYLTQHYPSGDKLANARKSLKDFYPANLFTWPGAITVPAPGKAKTDDAGKALAPEVLQNDQSALFGLSRAMVSDIRVVEKLRHGISGLRRERQAELAQAEADLEKLEDEIAQAQKKLKDLDRARIEAFDDHALAQRLLAEHWAAVEQRWAERKRILEGHKGLFHVRVRETPLSPTLPDPLDLRFTDADDLVPGCASETTELPEDLLPFLEAVYDIPVGDWSALRDQAALLPGRERVQALVGQRRERLAGKRTTPGGSALAQRLGPLHQQNQGLTRDLSKRGFSAAGALSEVQRQARDLLSLDDLMTGPPHKLRQPVQTLHQQLGNAAACLVQRLRAISPGLRAQWAEMAEADLPIVRTPNRWPGLAQAETADFNGVRTLVELIGWWFRQLHQEADGASLSVLVNFLRACLLHAAGDDPDQTLRGSVASIPGRFRIGDRMRVKLNREAAPGALLTLMSPDQRVVGALRVEDSDEQGAVAIITQVLDATAEVSTAFQVSARTTVRRG
ncbi:MAG: hypothetical protein HZB71_01850 [Betaproteobacteria bacterium]|nr:hypothetical protein [Betaproteobacteria bacterium]